MYTQEQIEAFKKDFDTAFTRRSKKPISQAEQTRLEDEALAETLESCGVDSPHVNMQTQPVDVEPDSTTEEEDDPEYFPTQDEIQASEDFYQDVKDSPWTNEEIDVIWKVMTSRLGNKINIKDAESLLDECDSVSDAVSKALTLTHVVDMSQTETPTASPDPTSPEPASHVPAYNTRASRRLRESNNI